MKEDHIVELLRETKAKALANYSNFHVAAVLVDTDDEITTGFNIESSSYGLTICAERVALFKALTEGKRKFKSIYIMSDGGEPCPPCGACRQVLMDYAPGLTVIMVSETGEKSIKTLQELLPNAFVSKNLDL